MPSTYPYNFLDQSWEYTCIVGNTPSWFWFFVFGLEAISIPDF
ncbi:hypothetical protein PN498_16935 [Oscillatoria sp. CS-180]|nr:hypothetical protein [Oscillatoria sp. CS-180]MDB9527683.1 hypothetical protein [Oscillatoria sp. CS-180]